MSQIKVLLGITVINLSLLAVFASPIEPFGSSAIDAIFSRKENAIVLFLDDSEASTNLLSIATAFAEDTPGDVSISYILKESNADHFTRFSQHIGIDVSETPKLLVIVARKDRYLYKGEPIQDTASLKEFYDNVAAGLVAKFIKSEPIPQSQTFPLRTYVGDNFEAEVLKSEKEFFVKYYAPWCDHCKVLAPIFQSVAEALSNNPNLVLAEFDSSKNDAIDVQIMSYPTIYFYSKDKTIKPIKCEANTEAELVQWLKDHSQYPWVQPVKAEPTEDLKVETTDEVLKAETTDKQILEQL